MAPEIEERVLSLLSAIEVPSDADEQIEVMGAEAVNVACEVALGTYVALRPKVRTNAAAVVSEMHNEQAKETLALLVTDPDDDVAIRALRAVGRRDEPELLARAALILRRPDLAPLVAVEAVDALAASADLPIAREALDEYRQTKEEHAPAHRRSSVVQQALDRVAD